MKEIRQIIRELISGCGNMSTDETIEAIEQHVIKVRIEELELFYAGINGKDFERSMERIAELKKKLKINEYQCKQKEKIEEARQ